MIFISHRGNIEGRFVRAENAPEYVLNAIYLGFECEVDTWFIKDRFFLGHDNPKYPVDANFMNTKGLWFHAKNIFALEMLHDFWNHQPWFAHDRDPYALTSNGYFWTYPGLPLTKNSICVLPKTRTVKELGNIAGICSDNIEIYRQQCEGIGA